MRRTPRNLEIACNHASLTHFGGLFFLHEFVTLLQLRRFLTRQLDDTRRHCRYSVSQVLLAIVYPIILGFDRLETASLLRSNGTFQYLTGLPSFPDPQTLRRFLIAAPERFCHQLQTVNDRLLHSLVHLPNHRSRLIFDLDSTVVPVFGSQEQATIGYNPRYHGRRSYHPLLCLEANASSLWGIQLRPGKTSTWDGSLEMLKTIFASVPADIREVRARADSGFAYQPVLQILEDHHTQYAVVARVNPPLQRLLPDLAYQPVNRHWEMAELEHRLTGWPHARRYVVARRLIEEQEDQPTLFSMGRYLYRVWITNTALTPLGVRYFYDDRAAMEPRIRELREDFTLCRIPTASFSANALYLEIVRLAYNLVNSFQRLCLSEPWQNLTLQQLRYKLFLIPAELVRPHNRPTLRLRQSPALENLTADILKRLAKIRPLPC
jgi:hypothetical protein